MIVRVQRSMGLYILVCLTSYARHELMKVQRTQLVLPTAAWLRHLAIILFPEEQRRVNKSKHSLQRQHHVEQHTKTLKSSTGPSP